MVRDDREGMYSELPASRAERSARLRSTNARRSRRVTPLRTTVPPKAFSSARAPIVSATNSCAECGMTAPAVGPMSAPSGSTGGPRPAEPRQALLGAQPLDVGHPVGALGVVHGQEDDADRVLAHRRQV